jgi:hypothetical protein
MTITKEDFMAYEDVRESGVTNMFDVKTVSMLSGLERPKIIEIMSRYNDLESKFKENKDEEHTE